MFEYTQSIAVPMSTLSLSEYRCQCGKLLFKGFLFAGTVEVKCRRCGTFFVAEEFESGSCVSIECDNAFTIVSVCESAQKIFGYRTEEMIGKSLGVFFPILADRTAHDESRSSKDRSYIIKKNELLLRDGSALSVKSFILRQRDKNGTPSGYRMMNWVSEKDEKISHLTSG